MTTPDLNSILDETIKQQAGRPDPTDIVFDESDVGQVADDVADDVAEGFTDVRFGNDQAAAGLAPEVVRKSGAMGGRDDTTNHISVIDGNLKAGGAFGLTKGMTLAQAGGSGATFRQLARAAGLDYAIVERPIPRTLGGDWGSLGGVQAATVYREAAPDTPVLAAYYRDDTESLLGVVGRQHRPLNPRIQWDAADNLSKATGIQADRVFSRDNGATLIAQFKSAELATPRGPSKGIITFGQGVAGNGGVFGGAAQTLAICQNTARAARGEAIADGLQFRHIGDVVGKLDILVTWLRARVQSLMDSVAWMQRLDGKRWTQDDMTRLIEAVLPLEHKTRSERGQKIAESRIGRRRNMLREHFEDSTHGAEGKSALDAFMALTYFSTHDMSARTKVRKDREGKELGKVEALPNDLNVMMGSAGVWQDSALATLAEMAEVPMVFSAQ